MVLRVLHGVDDPMTREVSSEVMLLNGRYYDRVLFGITREVGAAAAAGKGLVMIDLQLVRLFFTLKGHRGGLSVGGMRECVTLEDHSLVGCCRGQDPRRTCIPPGRYKVVLVDSQRFGLDIALARRCARIQRPSASMPATRPPQTEGCILVGQDAGAD